MSEPTLLIAYTNARLPDSAASLRLSDVDFTRISSAARLAARSVELDLS